MNQNDIVFKSFTLVLNEVDSDTVSLNAHYWIRAGNGHKTWMDVVYSFQECLF
jgi:hypothetical protein